jgi:hypothetical protein
MTYDRYRAGELTLALMYLTLHDDVRAWKGYSWEVLDHLFQLGLIADPRGTAKSVVLTPDGLARSRALFDELLAAGGPRLGTAAHAGRAPHSAGGPDGVPAGVPAGVPDGAPTATGRTLSEPQRAEAARLLAPFCRPSPDPAVRAKLRIAYRGEGPAVVLFEARPHLLAPASGDAWGEEPVAKFRYVASRRVWRLFCMHRDWKWHRYELLPESNSLAELTDEVGRDPSGIFWG